MGGQIVDATLVGPPRRSSTPQKGAVLDCRSGQRPLTGEAGKRLLRLDIVIPDELGYLSFSFSEWADVFGDAKMTTALRAKAFRRLAAES